MDAVQCRSWMQEIKSLHSPEAGKEKQTEKPYQNERNHIRNHTSEQQEPSKEGLEYRGR